VNKILDELIQAHQNGDKDEVEGILKSLQMPSQKEWRKLIRKLIYSAAEAGVLRAHLELMRLKELYEFAENEDDTWNVVDYELEVVFPEEAREFLDKYSLEISVITDETVLNRIREALREGLEKGLPIRDITKRIREKANTWLSDWHAETIARTETSKMYNAGRLARWLDPEVNGFVEALQYDAIVDRRTTELCRSLDGKIVSIQRADIIAEYTPPNHFQCRSTWLPVTKYEEWEDNFDTTLKPDEGFASYSPLPKLLQGKTEPLVQPRKKIDPREVKDPDVIRNLNDDDFKIAIKNVTDIGLKLNLVLERAEKMLVRETNLREEDAKTSFAWLGFNSEEFRGTFVLFGKTYKFYMDNSIKPDIEKLMKQLAEADGNVEAMRQIVDEFAEQFVKRSPRYYDVVYRLRKALSMNKKVVKWDGLKPVKQTEESKKKFTIKEPPMTASYKNATTLRQAVKEAQNWILKYIDPALAPETGITLRFRNDIQRAYAKGAKGEIWLGPHERAWVVIHEVGHVLHWNNKAVADLIAEFYLRRTKDEPLETFVNNEMAKKDKFFDWYVGRYYGWEEKYKNSKYATREFVGQEILSMGLETIYYYPLEFYRADKEHFLLTYAIIRGLF